MRRPLLAPDATIVRLKIGGVCRAYYLPPHKGRNVTVGALAAELQGLQ